MRRLLPLLLLVTLARSAAAAPCDQLPNPIYLQVGDTQLNLMKRLGRALRDNAPKPITLVFVTSGSCTNIQAIYTRVPITGNMQYVPSIAENSAWTPASATLTCTAPTGGVVPDIANSALLNSACTTETPPASVHLQQGPVQAYVMAVPVASSQLAITYEEAYFVFGFGAAGMITPWIDEAQMFIRTVTKSTLLAWGANISVPADKWKGQRFDGSPAVVSALQTSTSPEKAIGILGVEVADGLRNSLRILAFRAKGQRAAYFPDSTSTARDKQNVRDGHYTVWSPTVWMDTVDGSSVPVKADARYVVDLVTGKTVTPAPNFAPLDSVAAVGLVPDCAMGVTRSFEGGPLSIYKPAESCVCKYESLVQSSSCATCSASQPCTSGTCRDGFCEVQ
ncbi:MAG: hypothetical protein IPQ07_19700 [Myxococcales bacterium]|nr:hypothetical protein [Myxococcales bacterium]